MAPKPAFQEFGGGAFTNPSRSVVTPRMRAPAALQHVQNANSAPLYHPTHEYRVLGGPETKLPAAKMKEAKPLGAQELTEIVKSAAASKLSGKPINYFPKWQDVPKAKAASAAELNQLHRRGLLSDDQLDDGKAQLASGAASAEVAVSRPDEGKRLVVRAPAGALKSKWAGVPPRPSTANPPRMPTDAKITAKMSVDLTSVAEVERVKAELVAAAVAKAASAAEAKATKAGETEEEVAAAKAEASAKAKAAEPPMADILGVIRKERNASGVDEALVPGLDMIVALFPMAAKTKWRLELRCEGWQRAIGVMTETPTASFKLGKAGRMALDGRLSVRGATVGNDGKCSHWSEWRKVEPPPPSALALEAATAAAAAAAAAEKEAAAAEATTADANNDGRLDFDEFCAFVRDKEGVSTLSADEMRARFEKLDVDASGFISMAEYLEFALREAVTREAAREEAKAGAEATAKQATARADAAEAELAQALLSAAAASQARMAAEEAAAAQQLAVPDAAKAEEEEARTAAKAEEAAARTAAIDAMRADLEEEMSAKFEARFAKLESDAKAREAAAAAAAAEQTKHVMMEMLQEAEKQKELAEDRAERARQALAAGKESALEDALAALMEAHVGGEGEAAAAALPAAAPPPPPAEAAATVA